MLTSNDYMNILNLCEYSKLHVARRNVMRLVFSLYTDACVTQETSEAAHYYFAFLAFFLFPFLFIYLFL